MKHIITATAIAATMMGLPISQASAQYEARPGSSLYAKPVTNDASKAFMRSGDGYVHWLTSVNCAVENSSQPLLRRKQYTVQGHSVGCEYGDRKTYRANFGVRPFDKDETPASMAARVAANLEKSDSVKSKSGPQEIKMDFAGEPIACVKISYDFEPMRTGPDFSETFVACNMLTMAFSANWRGQTSNKAKGEVAISAFLKDQQAARSHLRSCITEGKRRREIEPSKATGLNIAVDRFGYDERGNPCFSGNVSAKDGRDAMLLLMWPGNPDTPNTIHSVAQNGAVNRQPVFQLQDLWAGVAATERGPGGYIMVKKDADGTLSSFGGFLRIVNSGTVYGNYLKVLSGELKPQTVSKPANADGGQNITIG